MPTQLGKHFWPGISFVLGLRIDYLSPTLYFTDILFLALTIVFISIFAKELYSRAKTSRIGLWHVATLAVLLPFIYSAFYAPRPLLVFYGFIKLLELILFSVITAILLQDKTIRVKTFYTLLLTMIFQSFLALSQFFAQSSIGGFFYFFGERTFSVVTPGIATGVFGEKLMLRPYATFPHPNLLAGFLLLASIITFYISQKESINSRFSVLVWILSFFSIILSLSRLTIVLTSAFWLFVIIQKISLKKDKILWGAIILVFIVLAPFLAQRFKSLSLESETLVLREKLLVSSWEMFLKSPVFGVGQGHFLVKLPEYTNYYGTTLFLQPVHSIYFLILAEWGILGVFAVAIVIYKLLLRVKTIKGSEKAFIYFVILTISILGFFDHYLLTLQQGQMLLAFCLGLIFAITSNKSFSLRDLEKYPKPALVLGRKKLKKEKNMRSGRTKGP